MSLCYIGMLPHQSSSITSEWWIQSDEGGAVEGSWSEMWRHKDVGKEDLGGRVFNAYLLDKSFSWRWDHISYQPAWPLSLKLLPPYSWVLIPCPECLPVSPGSVPKPVAPSDPWGAPSSVPPVRSTDPWAPSSAPASDPWGSATRPKTSNTGMFMLSVQVWVDSFDVTIKLFMGIFIAFLCVIPIDQTY